MIGKIHANGTILKGSFSQTVAFPAERINTVLDEMVAEGMAMERKQAYIIYASRGEKSDSKGN